MDYHWLVQKAQCQKTHSASTNPSEISFLGLQNRLFGNCHPFVLSLFPQKTILTLSTSTLLFFRNAANCLQGIHPDPDGQKAGREQILQVAVSTMLHQDSTKYCPQCFLLDLAIGARSHDAASSTATFFFCTDSLLAAVVAVSLRICNTTVRSWSDNCRAFFFKRALRFSAFLNSVVTFFFSARSAACSAFNRPIELKSPSSPDCISGADAGLAAATPPTKAGAPSAPFAEEAALCKADPSEEAMLWNWSWGGWAGRGNCCEDVQSMVCPTKWIKHLCCHAHFSVS